MHIAIDWTRPWYASINTTAEQVVAQPDWRSVFNQFSASRSLTNHRGLPISFVDQAVLPDGIAYETFISATGGIPTRNNLHDFFNALVWLSFPGIKRQLNALQAAQIANGSTGAARGPTRDAATIFDENAALLVINDTEQGHALIHALRDHQWHSAFLDQRDNFIQHAEAWVFGHALLEKLVTPYKAISAHAWVVMAPVEFHSMTHNARREWLDAQVASELSTPDLHAFNTMRFTALPVLGIPGWWPAQDREFYDDARVFRAKNG